jgi:hypothetical protein
MMGCVFFGGLDFFDPMREATAVLHQNFPHILPA